MSLESVAAACYVTLRCDSKVPVAWRRQDRRYRPGGPGPILRWRELSTKKVCRQNGYEFCELSAPDGQRGERSDAKASVGESHRQPRSRDRPLGRDDQDFRCHR